MYNLSSSKVLKQWTNPYITWKTLNVKTGTFYCFIKKILACFEFERGNMSQKSWDGATKGWKSKWSKKKHLKEFAPS